MQLIRKAKKEIGLINNFILFHWANYPDLTEKLITAVSEWLPIFKKMIDSNQITAGELVEVQRLETQFTEALSTLSNDTPKS